MLRGIEFVDFCVQNEERIGVPKRTHKLALGFAHCVCVESRRKPRCARGVEIPSRSFCALLVEHRPRIDDVALMFGHFDAVFVVDVTENYTVFERSATEKHRAYGKKRVEPTSRLVDSLRNEVCGKNFLENIPIFKRIVPLSKRHRSRVEPAVEHFGCTHHFAAAFALPLYLVDIRTMQFDVVIEMRFFAQFLARADDVHLSALVAHPNRKRRAPISFS